MTKRKTPTKKKAKRKKPPVDPVLSGFHQELKTLIEGTDHLTPAKLHLIGQLVQAAQSILNIRNPRLRCTVGGPIGASYYSNGGVGFQQSNLGPLMPPPLLPDEEGESEGDEENAGAPPMQSALAARMGMDRETFGAKVLRELVTLVPHVAQTMREDPAQLVKAISVARQEGLDDLAKELETRLRGPATPSALAAPK